MGWKKAASARRVVAAGAVKRRRPSSGQSESQHGIWLFDWALKLKHSHPDAWWLVHVPNGGARSGIAGALLKAEGVRPGYPDYLLDAARGAYHGLRIELKRPDKWETEDAQEAWAGRLRAQGYCAHVCIGWRSAAHLLRRYLELPAGGVIPESPDFIYWGGEL